MQKLASSILFFALACGGAEVAPAHVTTAPPTPPKEGTTRIIVGGDSRDDSAHVIPWAFQQARLRGASAFIFLGDMELTPTFDSHFRRELDALGDIPFFPVLGNHEVLLLGMFNFGHRGAERTFKANFLGKPHTPVTSTIADRVVYSVKLPGHIHFVALDNVSSRGFGKEQLDWLAKDLEGARADSDVRHIFVGMHKPLAKNGVTAHSMEEDGNDATAESDMALDLFEHWRVEMIFASHLHAFAAFYQRGIRSYITGGLGAPLYRGRGGEAFHHFLVVDVNGDEVKVDVVRFDGQPSITTEEVERGE